MSISDRSLESNRVSGNLLQALCATFQRTRECSHRRVRVQCAILLLTLALKSHYRNQMHLAKARECSDLACAILTGLHKTDPGASRM